MPKKTKNKKTFQSRKRSLSRLMAIQIAYQYAFLGDEKKLDEVKKDVVENYLIDTEETLSSYREKIEEEFLDNLISGVFLDPQKLDEEISEFLKTGRSLEQFDEVLHQILRFGAFELKFMKDIPAKVVLDEYVDIAASFFDSKKVTFVNATLDNIAKKFRSEELQKTKTTTKTPHESTAKKEID